MMNNTSGYPRICLLTGTLNAHAGAERMTAVIANRLAALGYKVHVLSLWDHHTRFALDPQIAHDALFTQRPSFKRKYLATVLGIRRYLSRHRIDVLVEVDTMLTLFTVVATAGLGTRRIAWEHCHFDEDLGRPSRRWARRLAARSNDAIVVLTERDRKRWQEALGPRIPVESIVNPLPFAYPERAVSGDARTVLAVGRLTPVKGFDVLLAAWARLRDEFPDWKLVIVGEGEERPRLEALIKRLGIDESVDMPGATDDVESYYRTASILCLTSRYEGFGMVLVEAMAYGLAVVSTACETGPREILADQDELCLVPVDDAPALAEALARLMRDDHARATNAAAGRHLARRFTWEEISLRWRRLIGRH